MALGNLMFLTGDLDQAIEYRRKAIELAPNAFTTVGGLAIRLSEANQEQEAVELFERAIRLSPKHPWWVEFGYGMALHLVGRKEEAVETYKRGLNTLDLLRSMLTWVEWMKPRRRSTRYCV